MIAMLTGRVALLADDHLVLDVGGVGYRVFVTTRLVGNAELDDELRLYISTQVREDAFHLFGFESLPERAAFESLIAVSQVGRRLAMATLSTFTRNQLAQAIAEKDVTALQRIPGVGKRTAQRLVVELEGKILPEFFAPSAAPAVPARPDDALPLALARLGFKRTEIERAQAELEQRGLADRPDGERIQQALKFLGRMA